MTNKQMNQQISSPPCIQSHNTTITRYKKANYTSIGLLTFCKLRFSFSKYLVGNFIAINKLI